MSGAVIAIDGPAASGKSSTARAVADALGFTHLDSGALYRGLTLVAIREAERRGGGDPLAVVSPEDVLRCAEDRGLALHHDGRQFAAYLQGEPVDAAIRTPEVTALVSPVSAMPVVREWVNSHLRAMVRAGQSVVVDGRDIGTVVFPDADLKVFLTASPRVRAERRLGQRGEGLDPGLVAAETAALAARDHADSTRAVAPLRQAADAHLVDSSDLTFRQAVDAILALARARGLGRPD